MVPTLAPRGLALAVLLTGFSLSACATESGPPQGATPVIDGERALDLVRRQVALGPRPAGSEAAARLRDLLEAELTALDLEVWREAFRSETPEGPVDFENLMVELPGRALPDHPDGPPLVYLLAHMDTKRMPFEFVGANDGASGAALLVELARALAPLRGARPVTYRLLWVDGEEAVLPDWVGLDNTYGSRHHVRQLELSGEIRRVAACVVLDMIGDRDLGLLREAYSDRQLRRIFENAAREAGHAGAFRGLEVALRDDHLAFVAAGVPSVVLIDFTYGPGNTWWHTADDTVDKLSAESLQTVGEIVLAGLPALEAWAVELK